MYQERVIINEEQTKDLIENLERELKQLIDSDEIVSRVMFRVLIFSSQYLDDNILYDYSLKYFKENKEYFMNIIP